VGKIASRAIGLNTSPLPSTRILPGKVLIGRNTDGYQKAVSAVAGRRRWPQMDREKAGKMMVGTSFSCSDIEMMKTMKGRQGNYVRR
jgi:hypothetical protein